MRGLGVENPNAVGALGAVQWTVRDGTRPTDPPGTEGMRDVAVPGWSSPGSAGGIHRAIWNSIAATAVVLDRAGVIVDANQPWIALAESVGRVDGFIGTNYLDVARWAAQQGDDSAGEAASGIADVVRGTADEFVLDYHSVTPSDSDEGWFRMRAIRLESPSFGVLVTHD